METTEAATATKPSVERDPLPWVHHYDSSDRAEINDLPGSLRDFAPREGYEQDRLRYRLGQRY